MPTRLEFAIRTRGAHSLVRKTATGLPDWTRRVSSSSRRRSSLTIASKASQLRAALPVPPYTTRLSGSSATSGSRLFMSIRRTASCCQPFVDSVVPRGARTGRGPEGEAPGVSVLMRGSLRRTRVRDGRVSPGFARWPRARHVAGRQGRGPTWPQIRRPHPSGPLPMAAARHEALPVPSLADGERRDEQTPVLEPRVVRPQPTGAGADVHGPATELCLRVAGDAPRLAAGALVVGVPPVPEPGVRPGARARAWPPWPTTGRCRRRRRRTPRPPRWPRTRGRPSASANAWDSSTTGWPATAAGRTAISEGSSTATPGGGVPGAEETGPPDGRSGLGVARRGGRSGAAVAAVAVVPSSMRLPILHGRSGWDRSPGTRTR